MARIKIAPEYTDEYLETERPQPLCDNFLESLSRDVMSGKMDPSTIEDTYEKFKTECQQWIFNSHLNQLAGFESFLSPDIIIGCTQFIDSIYMTQVPQVLEGDYRYHQRLGNWETRLLRKNIPLIIALPFPNRGSIHPDMNSILDQCIDYKIPVHIDGAWITCCRDINFDFSHPAIRSVGISLSKGLGLGWNRVGLRWTKKHTNDSIKIMNDFNMNNRALVMIGLHYIRNVQSDYLWKTHGDRYYKVCDDFNLEPTNSIYLAMRNGSPVGVSPLIRYLENAEL